MYIHTYLFTCKSENIIQFFVFWCSSGASIVLSSKFIISSIASVLVISSSVTSADTDFDVGFTLGSFTSNMTVDNTRVTSASWASVLSLSITAKAVDLNFMVCMLKLKLRFKCLVIHVSLSCRGQVAELSCILHTHVSNCLKSFDRYKDTCKGPFAKRVLSSATLHQPAPVFSAMYPVSPVKWKYIQKNQWIEFRPAFYLSWNSGARRTYATHAPNSV